MRSRRSSSSPFGQEIYLKKSEIDAICEDALREAGLLPSSPEPVRIERFVEKHFSCRLVYEEVAEGVLGCTAFKPDGGIALVAVSPALDDGSDTGRRRSRSTSAHEAGHCLMHPILFMTAGNQEYFDLAATGNVDFKERRILCRSEDFRISKPIGYDGKWWEYQANRAIGGLLLPKKLMIESLKPYLKPAGLLGLEVLPAESRTDAERHIANVFDVNPIVARIRLSETYPESSQHTL